MRQGLHTKQPLCLRKGASLVAQLVKRLPAMQETRVQFLAWEDPLEKEMAACSSILAWKIPWTEELGRLHSIGSQELDTTEQLKRIHPHTHVCLRKRHRFEGDGWEDRK